MTTDWDRSLNSVEENEGRDTGQTIERGPDGKIVHSTLSPERAKEIGQLGGAAAGKRDRQEADALAAQVLEILPALEDPAKGAVRETLLRHYCRFAVSEKGASGLTAIEGISRLVGEAFASAPKTVMPKPGEVCGVCGRPDPTAPLLVNGAGLTWLRKLLVDAAPQIVGGTDV